MTKEPKDPLVYMGHIVESIEAIETYTDDRSRIDFFTDQQLQDAVVRRLEIIGEATSQTPQSFKDRFVDIPWKKIAATRNILIHEYTEIDLDLAWNIVKKDLPTLKKEIQGILYSESSANS